MLLSYHGINVSEARLAVLCNLDPDGGIDPEVLLEVAESFGLTASARTATLEDLRTITNEGAYPIALLTALRETSETTIHAVVVRRVYRRKIRLYDPLVGKVSVPIVDFLHRWIARGRWLIILRSRGENGGND